MSKQCKECGTTVYLWPANGEHYCLEHLHIGEARAAEARANSPAGGLDQIRAKLNDQDHQWASDLLDWLEEHVK